MVIKATGATPDILLTGLVNINFFNSDIGSALRLRGVFGQIVQAGVVTVGDIVEKG